MQIIITFSVMSSEQEANKLPCGSHLIAFTSFYKPHTHVRQQTSIIRNSIEKPIIDYGLTQSIIENCRDNMVICHTNLFERNKNI